MVPYKVCRSCLTVTVTVYNPVVPYKVCRSCLTVTVTVYNPVVPYNVCRSCLAVTVTVYNPVVPYKVCRSCFHISICWEWGTQNYFQFNSNVSVVFQTWPENTAKTECQVHVNYIDATCIFQAPMTRQEVRTTCSGSCLHRRWRRQKCPWRSGRIPTCSETSFRKSPSKSHQNKYQFLYSIFIKMKNIEGITGGG